MEGYDELDEPGQSVWGQQKDDMVHLQDVCTSTSSLDHSRDLLSGIDQRIIPPTDLPRLSSIPENEHQPTGFARRTLPHRDFLNPFRRQLGEDRRPEGRKRLSKVDAPEIHTRANFPRRAVGARRSSEFQARNNRNSSPVDDKDIPVHNDQSVWKVGVLETYFGMSLERSRERCHENELPVPESKYASWSQPTMKYSEFKARETRRLLSPGGKIKQGLAGLANGYVVSAMADTGSRKNVISAVYAKNLGLKIQGSSSSFTLGSSRKAFSVGTVSLLWSFAEDPKRTMSVVCDVLPHCIYDLILGNSFLTATETMSKYRHRLSRCFFSMDGTLPAFAFLGDGCQRLEGILADEHNVLAVPDTGADRNVMSLQYVIDHDLHLKKRSEHRDWLRFADGSFEETVGQVDTYWTFATGKRIPVTFEILKECCSDVIIGEEICTRHNVFEDHSSSLIMLDSSSDSYELAPFDFISGWNRVLGLKKERKSVHGQNPQNDPHLTEQRRRDIWNFRFDYGASATTGEKELEKVRRSLYEDARRVGRRMPVIPSIPTAPSAHVPPHRSDPRSEGRSTQR